MLNLAAVDASRDVATKEYSDAVMDEQMTILEESAGDDTTQVVCHTYEQGFSIVPLSDLGGSGSPTGTITMYGGSSAPSGWLLCQGQAISRTTYADLFAVIGTTYGFGNGSTTFNLPNLQGRFPLGKSNSHALASTGGAETHTLTVNEMPAHTHGSKSLTGWAEAYGDTGIVGASGGVSGVFGKGSTNLGYGPDYNGGYQGFRLTIDASHEHDSVGGGAAHENMPPYQTVNYIIKY